jgi:protein tyrosine/serine phosphatase
MRRRLPYLLGTTLALLLVGVPLAYASYLQTSFRNLRVVENGVLVRSGQMTPAAFARVLHDHGIRTVVSLRGVGDNRRGKYTDSPDAWEEEVCRARGVRHVRLPPRNWGPTDPGPAPVEPNLRAFFAVLDDPANHPVLVHCFAGVHRTGAYCALFRMEYHGWANAEAIAEMRAFGYLKVDDEEDVLNYLEAYRPRQRRGR